jgi:hypothetical protein
LSILEDNKMRIYFDHIMIGTQFPISPHFEINKKLRIEKGHRAELILDALYKIEPRLEQNYGNYFAVTALPVNPLQRSMFIEFVIIPSERLHIEMIRSLGKYLR